MDEWKPKSFREDNAHCVLCGSAPVTSRPVSAPIDGVDVRCDFCGEYVLTTHAVLTTPIAPIAENLHLLSGLVRHNQIAGRPPFAITAAMLSEPAEFEAKIRSRAPRGISQQGGVLLDYIAARSKSPGDVVALRDWEDRFTGYCKGNRELRFLLDYLIGRRLLVRHESQVHRDRYSLTAAGWDEVEGRAAIASRKSCFVAMWFNPQMDDAFANGILPLEKETGFSFVRIDRREFNDKICDQILAEIRRSRFMIADVTGHRRAVYFEAGFAMGLELPVIWTCRKSSAGKIPNFDTRQYNHIVWDTPADLRERLLARIRATIVESK